MRRRTEPELMVDPAQALAYHEADFSDSHGRRIEIFRALFPALELDGGVLDLGCGSGDVLLRFARAFPAAHFVGVDGSAAMLELAAGELRHDPQLRGRVRLEQAVLPAGALPRGPWQLIMSHCLLHHLHQPEVLWQSIRACAAPGSAVFVIDLRRPSSVAAAHRLVAETSAGEPQVLQRDFFASLCAAFEPEEVRAQLQQAQLGRLSVHEEQPYHLSVSGRL